MENCDTRDPSDTGFLHRCGSIPKCITAEGAAFLHFPGLHSFSLSGIAKWGCCLQKVICWCERACCEHVVETALVSGVKRETPATSLALARCNSSRWWECIVYLDVTLGIYESIAIVFGSTLQIFLFFFFLHLKHYSNPELVLAQSKFAASKNAVVMLQV